MNKEKLFDVYTHFIGEGNKSRLKGTIAGNTDALICSRIAEMLWLMYKEEGGSNE